MVSEIKAKYGTVTSLTITLASLSSSSAGVGRQSTLVDNTTALYQQVLVYGKITTGTSPTANRTIQVYALRSDNNGASQLVTDGAGASDAGLTVVTAQLIAVIPTDATSNKTYTFDALLSDPGPEWGVAVVHDTGVALHATGSNHALTYIGVNPESQ